MSETILTVRNFSAGFHTDQGDLKAVDGVDFELGRGETLGIVGESGCGKSVTALSLMKLLPIPAGKYFGGEIIFNGKDILKMERRELYELRGNRISIIFQEPMTALNPVIKIGRQMAEVLWLHRTDLEKNEIYDETVQLLKHVGIPEPEQRLNEYPHQLSGGMRQRVMIAMALACRPDILIADEPTTALDVTIQAQILDLISRLQEETGMSVIFITHDMGVIAQLCDRVMVMYAGKVVEKGRVLSVFQNPAHPYTEGLLSSIPRFSMERKSKLPVIEGMVPSIQNYPAYCRFESRCSYSFDKCKTGNPEFACLGDNHSVSCYKYGG